MKTFRTASVALAFGASVMLASSAMAFGGHGGGGGGGHMGGGFGGGSHLGGGFGGGHSAAAQGGMQTGRSVGFAAPNAGVAGANAAAAARQGVGANRVAGMGDHRGDHDRRGYGRGAGAGFGYGFGAFGYDDGFGYGDDYGYDSAFGYDNGGYDPAYTGGVQYGDGDPAVRSGRSAAVPGGSCSTPIKTCQLQNASFVGQPCSCRVPGGRSGGHVTP